MIKIGDSVAVVLKVFSITEKKDGKFYTLIPVTEEFIGFNSVTLPAKEIVDDGK